MLRRRSRGVAQFSQHMLGKAMDFNIPGVSLDQVRAAGLRQQRGGVGFYPSSGSPFVHLDVGSIRHWPRMTHDQLARVFPNGRTVHVPSDGQPLAGYALALADVERRGSSPSRVTLAAARDTGATATESRDAAAKPRRTMLSRLFGYGDNSNNNDDDEEERQGVTTRGRAKAPEEARKPVEIAAAVPMPRRPPSWPRRRRRRRRSSTPVASGAAPTPSWWPTLQPISALPRENGWYGSQARNRWRPRPSRQSPPSHRRFPVPGRQCSWLPPALRQPRASRAGRAKRPPSPCRAK
jgi:hypothetical protein